MPLEAKQKPLRVKQEQAIKTHLSDLTKKISTILIYRLEDEIAGLYECRISAKNPIPTNFSKNITSVLKMAADTLHEYFKKAKVKELLLNSIRMLSKNYFTYLASLDKRGFQ
jgi:hypothetical protein